MANFITVKAIDTKAIGKLLSTRLEADLGRATKLGVESVGKKLKELAEINARKTIRHTKPFNRPHVGGTADTPSYFSGFYMLVKGSRLNWVAEVGNHASDAPIQEGGRMRGAKGPNMRNPFQKRKILGWAQDRGLLQGVFREMKQRRLKSGRFAKKKVLTQKQVLFAICKSISRRGRPAHRNMARAGQKVAQDAKAFGQFAKMIEQATRV